MEKIVNKAQHFLLNNGCDDLILNDHRKTKPEDRIYTSDIMMLFLERALAENTPTSEEQLAAPAVVGRSELLKAFYLYIDDKWALGMLTDKVDEVIEDFEKSL